MTKLKEKNQDRSKKGEKRVNRTSRKSYTHSRGANVNLLDVLAILSKEMEQVLCVLDDGRRVNVNGAEVIVTH